MRPSRCIRIPRAAALLALLALPASAQTTSLESVSSEGAQGDADSFRPTLSLDGRFVAFHSLATNLVPGGSANGFRDVYVHDHLTGVTERISLGLGGAEPDGHSREAMISEDGRYVAFYSEATNLVAGDTNGTWDGFLHDRTTKATVRFSVDASGQQANGQVGGVGFLSSARWPSLSADGRYLAFPSNATNLVPGGTNGLWQVFVKDMQTGAVTLASPGPSGVGGDKNSNLPCLSADGAFVAFVSASTDLVIPDTNGASDVFVYELATAQLEPVSVSSAQQQGDSDSGRPALSGDGSIVVFQSYATNLVPGDVNGQWDVFARDRLAGSTELTSLSSSQQQGEDISGGPAVSKDGALVAFVSLATTFDPGDTNGVYDVYLRDRSTQTTARISLSSDGAQPDADCELPFLSPNGSRVAFQTLSDALVPDDANGAFDVFVRDPSFGCPSTVATYCTASATSIPGCRAAISGQGFPSLCLPNDFTIQATPTPGQAIGICFFGVSGPAAIPFGTQGGLICVAPPVLRSVSRSSGGTSGACDGTLAFTLADLLVGHPLALPVGATAHAQVWFRDPASPDGSALSDALWFQVCWYGGLCGPCHGCG